MSAEIDRKLGQLIDSWIDADSHSLSRIPALCEEILGLAASGGLRGFDGSLLHRVDRLSAKAEQRLAACVEIQTRTGEYSTSGALERSPRVATLDWEG